MSKSFRAKLPDDMQARLEAENKANEAAEGQKSQSATSSMAHYATLGNPSSSRDGARYYPGTRRPIFLGDYVMVTETDAIPYIHGHWCGRVSYIIPGEYLRVTPYVDGRQVTYESILRGNSGLRWHVHPAEQLLQGGLYIMHSTRLIHLGDASWAEHTLKEIATRADKAKSLIIP